MGSSSMRVEVGIQEQEEEMVSNTQDNEEGDVMEIERACNRRGSDWEEDDTVVKWLEVVMSKNVYVVCHLGEIVLDNLC